VRKLLNDPFAAVDEMLLGFCFAHDEVTLTASGRGVVLQNRSSSRRTGVITGGGSGHEPAFLGYLGQGLADGVAVGNVFASPSAQPVVEVARALEAPDGVLFVFGNYEGDIMNFGMAAELLELEGIASETVLVTDDVASAKVCAERRGVAGDVIVLKAAGARADAGGSLYDVAEAARYANSMTRTVGVGLGPCTVPTAGRPTFDLPEGGMDVGMGVHGEAGIRRAPLASADDVADELVDLILHDFARPVDSALVLINTLGATPLMEGYVFLNSVRKLLQAAGVEIHRALVGEFITSLEMAGLSLTVTQLDGELMSLLDAPSAAISAPRVGCR
jgi:phosphoenolpyruvate---glycerone phosphotransferase subunit DhaK